MHLQIIDKYEDKTNKLFASKESQQLIDVYAGYYPKIGFTLPWVGYFIIRENVIVGSCSFTGKPKDNKVELAYWTFEEFEGQGIASFACKELIGIAKNTNPSIIITAKTATEEDASIKILKNNGFTFTEVVKDEEIGNAWLWTLK